jgi:hypothetical protein
MKKVKLTGLILSVFFMLFLSEACISDKIPSVDGGSGGGEQTETEKTVTQLKTSDGRVYIDYLGRPFTLLGAQIRTDGLMNRGDGSDVALPPSGSPSALSAKDVEKYIKAAADFGFSCVQLAVDWRRVETAFDVYDFNVVDTFLRLCNENDIKAELLWFSTNMCGDTHSFHLPQYLYEDTEAYPRLSSGYSGWQNWMYGVLHHFVLDAPALMAREAKALKNLMDHIFEWNNDNGKKYPVISVQVHNEPDGLIRWRADRSQANLCERNDMTRRELWDMTLNALDNAGKAVKSGKYKVLTRVNLTMTYGVKEFSEAPGCSPLDVMALSGIDIVGDDPYIESPEGIASAIREFSVAGNYPHIAENKGTYANTASLILAAVCAGGGYSIYDLATPGWFVWMNDYNNSSYEMDHGILLPDLTDRPHTEEVRMLVRGLKKAGPLTAVLPLERMLAFNIEGKTPRRDYTGRYEAGGVGVSVSTSEGALAFAFVEDDAAVIFATGAARFTFTGKSLARVAYEGAYTPDGGFAQGDKLYPGENDLTLDKGQLVRVRFT